MPPCLESITWLLSLKTILLTVFIYFYIYFYLFNDPFYSVEADASAVDEFLQEGFLMATFQHQNILSLLGIMIRGRNPHIIVPLMENGDLKTFVSDKTKVSNEEEMAKRRVTSEIHSNCVTKCMVWKFTLDKLSYLNLILTSMNIRIH